MRVNIGGIDLPYTARMKLQVFQIFLCDQYVKVFQQVVKPLQWVPIVDVKSGSGLFFMHSLAVASGNLNFLEGMRSINYLIMKGATINILHTTRLFPELCCQQELRFVECFVK